MKQIEVTILDQSYVLGCPEGGETLLRAAVKAVDREMTAIRNLGKVKARERIAVLAALNLAYAIEQQPAVAPADSRSRRHDGIRRRDAHRGGVGGALRPGRGSPLDLPDDARRSSGSLLARRSRTD